MTVEVLIPWRAKCIERHLALNWVRRQYVTNHPDWTFTLARGPVDEWVKSLAVAPAARTSRADIVIVADGDVWADNLADAVQAVEDGAPWAIPHLRVHRLTREATADLLRGAPADLLGTTERPYVGLRGGGIVVLRRTDMLEVPLDPRFRGWGGEDEAWGAALTTLLGRAWRGDAPLVHLWHPPQPRITRRVGSVANDRLRQRYDRAVGDPAAMRALVSAASAGLSALT